MVIIAEQTRLLPFKFDDAQAVIDLINAWSQYLYGHDETELNEMMNDWTSPGFDAEEMIRVVENEQSEIIGYIDIWDTIKPHIKKYIWGILHPDFWDDGL